MRTFISILLGLVLVPILAESGEAAQLPALPQSFIDTTYTPPTGTIRPVSTSAEFTNALKIAVPGDTIVLTAGNTFTGPFTLPNKTGSGWIYIQSSAYSSLPPPGTRVSPSNAANMPKIVVNSAASSGAIVTAASAHHFRFVGIEIKPVAGNFVFDLVRIDRGTTDIVFDRCYIHGDPSQGGRRGLNLNATRAAVIDSHISDFKEVGADTQAILSFNTPGPLKIANNYLEATSENVMLGGVDSDNGIIPSDVEITRNYFFKPMSWRGGPYAIKNLLEFKNARRVLVEGNRFENNWANAQAGFAIVFTPRNEGGFAPWSTVEDITFRLNIVKNSASGIIIAGEDNVFQSQTTRRVLIQNNVIELNRTLGGDGRILQIAAYTGPEQDTTIDHNTGLITGSGGVAAFTVNTPKSNALDFNNNIFSRTFDGEAQQDGTNSLNAFWNAWTFAKNALIGATQSHYPANNFFPANIGAVGFVNPAGGNYRLSASSPYKNQATDGKDVGADIDAIDAAIGGTGPAPKIPAPANLRVN
jgi:hypothetical protein